MLFEEFTDPIMPERREPEEKPGYSDPELARTLKLASVKYPYYKRGPEAFMKFAQRSLKHSEETDQEHAAQIAELSSEIKDIKQAIAKLHSR
jgi:hypothetical protein